MNASTTASQQTANLPQDTPQALGALLARTRQARGLEPHEIALRLGLSQEVIRALEEGNAQQVDAPVFVRGYLLRYARFLGLPEQDILERYRNLGISEQPPLYLTPATPAKAGSHAVLRGVTYLLLAALLGWLGWLGYEQIPTLQDRNAADAQRLPAAALPPDAAQPPARHTGQPPAATVPSSPAPSPATPEPSPGSEAKPLEQQTALAVPPPAATAPTPAEAQPAAVTAPATPPLPLPPGHAELTLNFKGDCWVSIKDAAGQRLAYGVIKANTSNTFTGPAPFRLVLGNSSAVEIKLNGQTIDPATYVKRSGPSQLVLNLPKPGR